jgi:diguanylate cyclase (GGDEF)-like protein
LRNAKAVSRFKATLVPSQNRRNDNELRGAINAIQAHFFTPETISDVYTTVLEQVAELSGCDYATAWLADDNTKNALDIRNVNHKLTSDLYTSSALDKTRYMDVWLEQERNIFKSRLYQGDVPAIYKGEVDQDPEHGSGHGTEKVSKAQAALDDVPQQAIHSLALLPVIAFNQLRAIIVVANAKKPFENTLLKRLTPLLGATTSAIQSSDISSMQPKVFNATLAGNAYINNVLDNSINACVVVKENLIVGINPAARNLFGESNKTDYTKTTHFFEFIGKSISDYFPNFSDLFEWSNQPKDYVSSSNQTGPYWWKKHTIKRIDSKSTKVNLTVFRHQDGDSLVTVLQFENVSSNAQAGGLRRQTDVESIAIKNALPIGLIKVGMDWHCEFANDKWQEITEQTEKTSKGFGWIKGIFAEDLKYLLEDLYVCMSFDQEFKREIRLISPLGNVTWVEFQANALKNEENAAYGFIGIATDISEQRDFRSHLKSIALLDPLTGLANRTGLSDQLQKTFLALSNKKTDIALMFIDLDGFKFVNDTFGHHQGDLLLKEMARRLLFAVDDNVCVARFGGDEFVILFKGANNKKQLKQVANAILEQLSTPFELANKTVTISGSVGIAHGSARQLTSNALLKRADNALYAAKHSGKNTYRFFDANIEQETQTRVLLLQQLRQGLLENNFELRFQPITCSHTGKTVGMEALLRFVDNQNKLVMPNDFIPLIEKSHLITEIGAWVIEQSCRYIRCLLDADLFPENGYVSINASAKQLINAEFIDVIRTCSQKYRVPMSMLVVEITETTLINKPKQARQVLNSLRELGVKTAIDDFGTGYSSLTYLQQYAFDILKIDKSFTSDLGESAENLNIIRAIIALASSFGLSVIAEGVEQETHVGILASLGVQNIQGFIIAKPMNEFNTSHYMRKELH